MTPWQRAILHVDMDAFYASVEQHDNPELRGKPVLVGGSPQERGVVATASYEARVFGCRSAMPMAQALRLCPKALRVPPRHARYAEVSAQVFALFAAVTPLVQPVSLDEAFLDVTASQALFGDPVAIAQTLRRQIQEQTGLTASVGVASCRFVAKIASDMNKPNGMTVITADEIAQRLGPLPVRRIWGVGPVTDSRLAALGIRTIDELRRTPKEMLERTLGALGPDLWNLAHGVDDSPVDPSREEKSVSHENTFPVDVTSMEELDTELLDQADKVARRLRAAGLAGRVVHIKVRYDDFSTITRQTTLPRPTDLADTLYAAARTLLHSATAAGRRPVRLLGIGCSGFAAEQHAPERQLSLFASASADADPAAAADAKQAKLERMVDSIRTRFGPGSIDRAALRFKKQGNV